MFTDTHCHFYENTDEEKSELLLRAIENKVDLIIDIAYNIKSSESVIEFSKKHREVYSAVGIHPDSASEVNSESLALLEKLAREEKCALIGEIGLDYHYDGYDKKVQIDAFVKQMELAYKLGLPFSVHSRDCTADMISVLKGNKSLIANGGVMHCYSGSVESAKIFLDLGLHISFSGTLTFKNARALPEVCEYVPSDRILAETDSPYLAPVPFRGKVNEPKNVPFVIEKIAEIKKIPVESMAKIIRENTLNLFTKIPKNLFQG